VEIIATEIKHGQDCLEEEDVDNIEDSLDHEDITYECAPGLYKWSLIPQMSFTRVDSIYIK